MAVSGILRRWAPFAFAATALAVFSPSSFAVDPGMADYRFSQPYTHGNLTIFLVHGKPGLGGRTPITLQEALQQGVVRVIETGSVNQLEVENLGGDAVFIQSGDIVKGGKQDRVLSVDLILPPHSGKVSIASFCVEQGRWSPRDKEDAKTFSRSADRLPSRDIKVAANAPLMAPSEPASSPPPTDGRRMPQQRSDAAVGSAQGKVWRGVADMQEKLKRNVGTTVAAPQSASSLQLSMENEKLKQATEAYVAALKDAVDKEPDAIGFVFAINGQINSADVYGAPVLFRKMWSKLLQASVVEAIAERKEGTSADVPTIEAVRSFMANAEGGKRAERQVGDGVTIQTRDADKAQFLESRAKSSSGYVHRSYVAK